MIIHQRGFTLIETLITTLVLVTGLVGVAAMFSFATRTNLQNEQRTGATSLLSDKMEQFKATSITDSLWAPGGSLDPGSPMAGYFDSVPPYLCLWQITGGVPRTTTIVVYAKASILPGRPMELTRASTMASPTF